MTDLREALKVALDALERCEFGVISDVRLNATIQAVRQALAQPEQEPVAWIFESNYTAPPKREWVGLTDEEIDTWNIVGHESLREFVRAIEAKLKDKNS